MSRDLALHFRINLIELQECLCVFNLVFKFFLVLDFSLYNYANTIQKISKGS